MKTIQMVNESLPPDGSFGVANEECLFKVKLRGRGESDNGQSAGAAD